MDKNINKIKNKIDWMVKKDIGVNNIYSMLDRYYNNNIISIHETSLLKNYTDRQHDYFMIDKFINI